MCSSDFMAYDDDNAIVVWPEYFDVCRTRADGRRLPKSLCVENPSLDIIAKGATILDLEYRIFEEKSYPANWFAKSGCIRVERGKIKKGLLLIKIGQILIKNK